MTDAKNTGDGQKAKGNPSAEKRPFDIQEAIIKLREALQREEVR